MELDAPSHTTPFQPGPRGTPNDTPSGDVEYSRRDPSCHRLAGWCSACFRLFFFLYIPAGRRNLLAVVPRAMPSSRAAAEEPAGQGVDLRAGAPTGRGSVSPCRCWECPSGYRLARPVRGMHREWWGSAGGTTRGIGCIRDCERESLRRPGMRSVRVTQPSYHPACRCPATPAATRHATDSSRLGANGSKKHGYPRHRRCSPSSTRRIESRPFGGAIGSTSGPIAGVEVSQCGARGELAWLARALRWWQLQCAPSPGRRTGGEPSWAATAT